MAERQAHGIDRGETAAAESDVHSAAVVVADPGAPVADLCETFRLGARGREELADRPGW